MDRKEVSKGGDDTSGVSGYSECYNKLSVLGEYIEKLEKEVVSTRNCYYYIVKEMNEANEKIMNDIIWNMKRGNLLSDIAERNAITCDKLQNCYKEYFELYKLNNNVNNINKNKN